MGWVVRLLFVCAFVVWQFSLSLPVLAADECTEEYLREKDSSVDRVVFFEPGEAVKDLIERVYGCIYPSVDPEGLSKRVVDIDGNYLGDLDGIAVVVASDGYTGAELRAVTGLGGKSWVGSKTPKNKSIGYYEGGSSEGVVAVVNPAGVSSDEEPAVAIGVENFENWSESSLVLGGPLTGSEVISATTGSGADGDFISMETMQLSDEVVDIDFFASLFDIVDRIAKPPQRVALLVASKPGEAAIYIKDDLVGATTASKIFVRDSLIKSIVLRKDGFKQCDYDGGEYSFNRRLSSFYCDLQRD